MGSYAGIGCGFVGPASDRGDTSEPHLTVNTLAGATEFRLE